MLSHGLYKNDTVLKVKQKYHHFEGIKLGSKAELFLITAKQICRSFRIIAAMITILCLPFDFNLSEKAFKIGL